MRIAQRLFRRIHRFMALLGESVSDIAVSQLTRPAHLFVGSSSRAALRRALTRAGPRRHRVAMNTLKKMPFRRAQGRLLGPGVLDMKAGLAFFIFACELYRTRYPRSERSRAACESG